MKGGSAASTAVVELVKPETYEHLNGQFDNLVGGKGRKTTQRKASSKTPKKPSKDTKKDTKSAETKSKSSKSSKTSIPKTNKDKHTHKGGVCMICGGSLMKHMNDFDDKDLQSVYNKKGGATNALFNIKYDITNAYSQPAYGDITSRALDASTMKQMSYENPSSLSAYDKFVQYGNVSGSPVMKFNYTGGKSSQKAKKASKV